MTQATQNLLLDDTGKAILTALNSINTTLTVPEPEEEESGGKGEDEGGEG